MSTTVFLAFCILGCDFLLYVLYQFTYGEKRRGLSRRSKAPKHAAMNQPDARPFLLASRKFHGKRSAAPECAAANRQGRCQRSWPIQRGAGLPPYRVVFRAGQAVNNPRLSRSRKFFVSSPFVSTPLSFVVNNCPRERFCPLLLRWPHGRRHLRPAVSILSSGNQPSSVLSLQHVRENSFSRLTRCSIRILLSHQ